MLTLSTARMDLEKILLSGRSHTPSHFMTDLSEKSKYAST
jgi:hypothetical protein